MGHINMPVGGFLHSLSEDAGERSGFALTRELLLKHLPHNHRLKEELSQEDQVMLRVSSEVYADSVGDLLYALGAAEVPGMPTIGERLAKHVGRDRVLRDGIDHYMEIEAVVNHFMRLRNDSGKIDIDALSAELGTSDADLMDLLLMEMPIHLAHSPWFNKQLSVEKPVELEALFRSEALPPTGMGFFDQRFINYLTAQPDLLKEINWRQFEGLTAEYLDREGYNVELGPGRDDGGVDVRAWKPGIIDGPPAIIVQCKREKRKIGKVIVKALWADVVDEKAESGLVVTTNDVSPGAQKVIDARSYPVTIANKTKVYQWLDKMRKPSAGIVL